jgi:hypothetical protein
MEPRKQKDAEELPTTAAAAPDAACAVRTADTAPTLTADDLTLGSAKPIPQPPKETGDAEQVEKPPRAGTRRPVLPVAIEQFFLPVRAGGPPVEGQLVYRPALLGRGQLHFVRASYKVDVWQPRTVLTVVSDELPDPLWDAAELVNEDALDLERNSATDAVFAATPAPLLRSRNYSAFRKQFKDFLYRTQTIIVYKCPTLKQYSRPGETEGDFRVQLKQLAHEQRDLRVEKLRKRYASKLGTLKSRIRTAEEAVARERSQSRKASFDSAISFGSSLLGALLGRKLTSNTNVRRAASSMRSLGRAAQQRGDVGRAQGKLEELTQQLRDLEKQFEHEVAKIEVAYHTDSLDLEPLAVRPRKTDISAEEIAVVWTPWQAGPAGRMTALYDLKTSS